MSNCAIAQLSWKAREDMGRLRGISMDEGSVVLLADGSYTVVIPVDFTEGTKKYVMNINMATQQIQAEFTDMSAGVVEDTSMGALLKTATVYTVIGIRYLIPCSDYCRSILISCFKYIHAWEESKKKAAAPAPTPKAAAPAVKPVAAAPAVTGPDLSGDAG